MYVCFCMYTGVIPLNQIIDAVYLPEKRIGCRLDVRVKSLRIYSLHGEDGQDAIVYTIYTQHTCNQPTLSENTNINKKQIIRKKFMKIDLSNIYM